jgi:hypothetical protein
MMRPPPDLNSLPPSHNVPEFVAKWREWLEYRKLIRVPYKTRGPLNNLLKYPVDVCIRAIQKSLDCEWRGIFPDRLYHLSEDADEPKEPLQPAPGDEADLFSQCGYGYVHPSGTPDEDQSVQPTPTASVRAPARNANLPIVPFGEEVSYVLASGAMVRCGLVLVTPATAADWIKNNLNPRNRRSRFSTVVKYREEIKRNEWRETPEGIVFGADGVLINGEHRLRAIAESGKSVPLVVWRDWPAAAFRVFDTGRSRTVHEGDVVDGVNYDKRLYEIGRAFLYVTDHRPLPSELRAWVVAANPTWQEYGKLMESVCLGPKRTKLRVACIAAAFLALTKRPDVVRGFFENARTAVQYTGVAHRAAVNFVRWYENAYLGPRTTIHSSKAHTPAYAMAAALRQFFEGDERALIRPDRSAWTFWEELPPDNPQEKT